LALQLHTFKGGVHPLQKIHEGKRYSENAAIKAAKVPEILMIPMTQHIGAPCKPIVKKGDTVKMYELIGEPMGFVSAPIHSPVSGTVKDVKKMMHISGKEVETVIIQNDFQDDPHESVKPYGKIEDLTPAQLKEISQKAGLVGMGGATFPTHVKLSPPEGKKCDTVILNGAECEPFLTADHRLMLEKPEMIVKGLFALKKLLGAEKGIIGVEENKMNAYEAIKKACEPYEGIGAELLKTKYPQGAEKQIIQALTGRQVPSGGLPIDVGIVVSNVGTAATFAEAIETGKPLVERVVTVTGAVNEPSNLLARVGTTFKDMIEQCGGFKGEPVKIISGGPMMGVSIFDPEITTVGKGTSGILVLDKALANTEKESPCIRCGRCVEACPVGLMPLRLNGFAVKGMYDRCDEFHALDCIECGSCSFICPAKRNLAQSIRVAKKQVLQMRKNKK